MRYTGFIVILILSLGIAHAHPPLRNLLHKSYAQRAVMLLPFYHNTLHDADSVTIFRTIDSIAVLAKDNGDDDLLLETTLMRAHYFYYRDTRFPRQLILDKLDSLKTLGIDGKKLWLEIMAENMIALYNYNTQHYEQAFFHHRLVYNLVKDVSPVDFPHKQNCLLQMGMEYYHFKDYPESIFYIRKALEAEPHDAMTNQPARLSLVNTIGLAYQKMNKLDSADLYFRQTISEATAQRNTQWQCIASGNLGYSFFLRRDFTTAIPLLEKDVNNATLQHDWSLASGSQMVLGAISLERKEIDKAWTQLQLARQFVYNSEQYGRLETLYPLLSKLYAFRGQPVISVMYLDSAVLVRDSLARSFNSLLLLRAQQKVEMEQYNAEISNIRSQRKINVLERNISMGAVLLLMGVSVVIYKEQRRKNRQQQEKARRAGEDLANARKQLNVFAKNISEKNELIEMLQQQHGDETSEALQQLKKSTILTDEDWEYFRDLFEKVHQGYLLRLKEKVPGLTPAETRFIVLARLQLTGKEMAAMLGIGADAVRQLRSRVRKKLELGEEQNIDNWIAEV